jgi:ubiquinone/menaquinone biosynthesis C-methylase UbiE
MSVNAEHENPFAAEEHAASYDAWFDMPLGQTVDRLEKEMVYHLARPQAGETALDVGTGTGHWAVDLARRGLTVTGVDSSEAMLAVARRSAADLDLEDRMAWHQADAHALPFPGSMPQDGGDSRSAGRFALVLSVTTLEFVRDPALALAEMVRVTAPGGRVVVGVLNALSPWAAFYREQAETQDTPFRHAHFFTPHELVELLSRWGRPQWGSAVFVHPSGRRLSLARPIEMLGRTMLQHRGALLVGRVDP